MNLDEYNSAKNEGAELERERIVKKVNTIALRHCSIPLTCKDPSCAAYRKACRDILKAIEESQ